MGYILAVGSYAYAERFDVSDPTALARAGWDATKVYVMGADAGVTSSGDTVIAAVNDLLGVIPVIDRPPGDGGSVNISRATTPEG